MMQLGVSGAAGMTDNPGVGGVAAAEQPQENGGGSGGSSEVGGSGALPLGDVERSAGGVGGAGNRWPRQETLALLQIRHDMDSVFRDSSLKGPLWEEVSRKMAELGFQRSAKKCKEKFENVFKYHKRTKDGRASKSDGKTYRFFDQLEALENTPPPPPQLPSSSTAAPPPPHNNTVPSTSPSPTPISVVIPPTQASNNPAAPMVNRPPPLHQGNNNLNFHHQHLHMLNPSFLSNSTSSSSTSSDEDIQRRGGSSSGGRKRKWKDYFERLMRDVVQRQEDMQKQFLEALERRDRDRAAREEAWRLQEMARMNRERELLAQERQIAAAKDEAVISFLHKVVGQHNLQLPINFTTSAAAVSVGATVATPQERPPPPQVQQQQQSAFLPQNPPIPATTATATTALVTNKTTTLGTSRANNGGGGENYSVVTPSSSSSSRWPKAEVQALIDLRTSLDLKYHDNGPKGPLWEEISSEMGKLGYSRSSKRCKEKWENINKYYKKVKESNKKRPDDSKTCPYFHQLEALYKARSQVNPAGYGLKPDNPLVPMVVQPQQQWPAALPQQHEHEDIGNESNEDDDDDDGEDDDGDDDDQGGGYEMMSMMSKEEAPNTVDQ